MIYGINHCPWPSLSGRIFNGVNLVYKNDENSDTGRKPVRSYDPAWTPGEIETPARRGVNIAGWGCSGPPWSRSPAFMDDGYLRKIRDYAELCEKHGIYIFPDMHQELYSDLYGDGVPGWATIAAGAACEEPLFVWAEGCFTGEAVHTAYDHFWANDKAEDGVGRAQGCHSVLNGETGSPF